MSRCALWMWTRGKLGVGSGGVGELGWVDVEAGGVTPEVGVEYTFRFTFDYTAGAYGVEVQTGLTGFTRTGYAVDSTDRNILMSSPYY